MPGPVESAYWKSGLAGQGDCAIIAALVEKLKSLVGVGSVIYDGTEKTEPSFHDEVADYNYAKMQEVVVTLTQRVK